MKKYIFLYKYVVWEAELSSLQVFGRKIKIWIAWYQSLCALLFLFVSLPVSLKSFRCALLEAPVSQPMDEEHHSHDDTFPEYKVQFTLLLNILKSILTCLLTKFSSCGNLQTPFTLSYYPCTKMLIKSLKAATIKHISTFQPLPLTPGTDFHV